MKKNYLLTVLSVVAFICLFTSIETKAQGCVAIRGYSSCSGTNVNTSNIIRKGEFAVGSGYRYFKSFRHFRGNHEETERVEQGTQVINLSHFLDLNVSYGITDRLSLVLSAPFAYNDRSSMYEHGGNSFRQRKHTYSSGLGDMRLSATYWVFDPRNMKGNLAVGLGVKAPTGNYKVEDKFYDTTGNYFVAPVDQSIQLGDGGWGATIELQGFKTLNSKIFGYVNMFYLSNPRATNGVSARNRGTEMSVADQYMARLGAAYTIFDGLALSLGGRIEGIPANDIIGSSEGFRRPGYVISTDPGILYTVKKWNFSLTVPVALERNRVQSYTDKERSAARGTFVNGDAAFADYSINFNLAYRITRD
jgi:hypothetical protein